MTEKKQAHKGVVLYVAVSAASTPYGEIRPGLIAEEGAKILKTHGALFRPLEVTFKA